MRELLDRIEFLARRVVRLEDEVERLKAELLRFKPEPMSQRCRDGRHNGKGDDRCVGCACLCHGGEAS